MNKSELLQLNFVIDNQYLDKYIELINNNLTTKRQKFKTQKHHIIPRYYYRNNNINEDNSEHNLVNLLYKDHILAHYYLSLCSTSQDCFYNYMSIKFCINNSHLSDSVVNDLNQFLLSLERIQEIYEIAMIKMSEVRSGKKSYWTDQHRINQKLANGVRGKTLYHCGDDMRWFFEGTQPEGYVLGGSDKYKQLLSSQRTGSKNSNYGKHWSDEWKLNHSLQTKGRKESPEQRERKSKAHIGLKWIVNAEGQTAQIKSTDALPDGYIYGRKYIV